MYLGKSSSYLRAYAKSGYTDKINPEYRGIAKKYYNQKKELTKVQTVRKQLDKQIAYMQRVEKKIQFQLDKKKNKLVYTKDVARRFYNDLKNRQSLQQYKSQASKQNKDKATFLKSQSMKKIQQAKQYILNRKRSVAEISKSQNKKIRDMISLKQAKEWDDNKSRVSEIYAFEKNLKESCNRFFKEKNDNSMKLYESRMSSCREKRQKDVGEIQTLQQKLVNLKQKYEHFNAEKSQINRQIIRIKKQSKLQNGLIKSRLRSHSTLTHSYSQTNLSPSTKNH